MSQKSVLNLLIEAGLVPKETLSELERWRLLKPGESGKAGSLPLSSDGSGQSHEQLAKSIADALTRSDAQIKETALDRPTPVLVTLRFSDGEDVKAAVGQDGLGRYVVPTMLLKAGSKKRSIRAIRPDGHTAFSRVSPVTTLYEDDKPDGTVYELKR